TQSLCGAFSSLAAASMIARAPTAWGCVPPSSNAVKVVGVKDAAQGLRLGPQRPTHVLIGVRLPERARRARRALQRLPLLVPEVAT
ncbi:hypothetical protein, partial [Streptomyces mirabilis]|uniref:hypothetical protein n=1 Tax=Streptomyces mirabilis TaxID=68239 RepID=UPI00367EE1CE